MEPSERQQRLTPSLKSVVEVPESTYIELLISRRKLERVANGRELLLDLETHEAFAMQAESSRWRVQSA